MANDSLLDALRKADSGERRRLLGDHLHGRAAHFMGRAPDQPRLAFNQPLEDQGMDSLMSLDLADELSVDLQVELSSTIVFECATIDGLAEYLIARFG